MPALKKFLFCIVCLVTLTCSAQPFQPDAYGYVDDPAFLKLVQSRKYLLVGTYDSIAEMPGVFAARVFKDSATLVLLDVNGKELSVSYEKDPDEGSHNEPHKITREEKKNDTPLFGIFLKKGLYGVRNARGKEILPAKFDEITVNKENDSILICQQNGKWGIYSTTGDEIKAPFADQIVPIIKSIDFPTTAYAFQINEKWGLLSDKGTVISGAVYKFIRENPATPEVLTIVADNKVGFMHRSGNIIHEPFYESVFYLPEYAEYGIVSFKKPDGSSALLDIRTGKAFDFGIHKRSKKDFYEIVRNDGSKNIYGIRNLATGKEIIPTSYAKISDYNDGHWLVERYSENGVLLKGVIDTLGNALIPVKYESLDGDFYNGWSVFGNASRFGVINLKNQIIVPQKYESLKIIVLYNRKADNFRKMDYLIFSKEGKLGVMDLKERVVIQPVYSKIRSSNTGLMVVKNRQNGVISFDGKERIPFIYDWINDGPKPGIFKAKKAGQYYQVDFYGNSLEFTLGLD